MQNLCLYLEYGDLPSKKETIKQNKINAKHIFGTLIENGVQCGNR